ncbi:MAG: malic enzyme-like NAD(P)-binding protein, partial [Nitrososphaeraceae archaeon]
MTLTALYSALKASDQLLEDQRIVIFGAGTAGIGIADQIRDAMVNEGSLSREEATRRFWCVDINGLLTESMGNRLRDFQLPYARPDSKLSNWMQDDEKKQDSDIISLADVVEKVRPTVLIGTSTSPNAITESVVREIASHNKRPII